MSKSAEAATTISIFDLASMTKQVVFQGLLTLPDGAQYNVTMLMAQEDVIGSRALCSADINKRYFEPAMSNLVENARLAERKR